MEKLNIRCNKVLPSVYDDALSYYEVLCKVVAAMNELIENWNTAGSLPAPVEGEEGWLATVINGEWKASDTVLKRIATLEGNDLTYKANFASINQRLDEIYDGIVAVNMMLNDINRTAVV